MYYLIFFAQILIFYLTSKRVASVIFIKLKNLFSDQLAIKIFSLLFLPGTFLHEASHYLTAKLLFVPAANFNVTPEYEEGGIQMGSVSIGKTDPLRRFIIGVAPVMLGIIIVVYFSYLIWVYELIWQRILIAFLIFSIANSMFSSRTDMEGAVKLIFTILIFIGIFYYLGVDIKVGLSAGTIEQINEVIKTAAGWFLVPLGLNFIVLLFSKLF